jgi:hypothetical protein
LIYSWIIPQVLSFANSIKDIEKHEIFIKNGSPDLWSTREWQEKMRDRSAVSQEKNSVGDWTHFYRDAVDHNGAPMGSHEAKKVIMKVTNNAKN